MESVSESDEDEPMDELPWVCHFCQSQPPEWRYPLDLDRFRIAHPRHFDAGGEPVMCTVCANLYDAGDYASILKRFQRTVTSQDLEAWSMKELAQEVEDDLLAYHASTGPRLPLASRTC